MPRVNGLLDASIGKMRFHVLTGYKCGVCAIRLEVCAASPVAEVRLWLGRRYCVAVFHVNIRLGLKEPLASLLFAGDIEMGAHNVFPHRSRTGRELTTFDLGG
jgi:hypothetical protein